MASIPPGRAGAAGGNKKGHRSRPVPRTSSLHLVSDRDHRGRRGWRGPAPGSVFVLRDLWRAAALATTLSGGL